MNFKRENLSFLLLSIVVVTAMFLWEGHKGFDLWDEGFLWYGAQRVMQGEVPIRDFMAYDPARYYWGATVMAVLGSNGIIALRVASALLQALGVFIGLQVLARHRAQHSWLFWALVASVFVAWMVPFYKSIDIQVSIALIAGLAWLLEQPSARRCFSFGVLVGFLAIVGRNHGLYGVISGVCGLLWVAVDRRDFSDFPRQLVAAFAGLWVGYMPVIAMMIFIPGFGVALWESVRFLFEIKATNIGLPVPWPWRVEVNGSEIIDVLRGWFLGVGFIAILYGEILMIGLLIRRRIRDKPVPPLLLATALLSVAYSHYAYSRPDTLHLAMGVFPFLVGFLACVMYLSPFYKWGLAAMLAVVGWLVMTPLHPGWACYKSQQCVPVDVSGDLLVAHPNVPVELGLLSNLVSNFAPNGEGFYVAPFWPGAYAATHARSPVWEIYALFPRSDEFQRAEIERIVSSDVAFALILDVPLDGRDELRFSETHKLIYAYISSNFVRLYGRTPDSTFQLFVRKPPST